MIKISAAITIFGALCILMTCTVSAEGEITFRELASYGTIDILHVLRVDNLQSNTTIDEVMNYFRLFGWVTAVKIIQRGHHTYAWVKMHTEPHFIRAAQVLHPQVNDQVWLVTPDFLSQARYHLESRNNSRNNFMWLCVATNDSLTKETKERENNLLLSRAMTRGWAFEEFSLDVYPKRQPTQYRKSREVYLDLHSDIPWRPLDVNLTTNIESLNETMNQTGPAAVNFDISGYEPVDETKQAQFLEIDDTTIVEPDPMEAQESNRDGKYWPSYWEYDQTPSYPPRSEPTPSPTGSTSSTTTTTTIRPPVRPTVKRHIQSPNLESDRNDSSVIFAQSVTNKQQQSRQRPLNRFPEVTSSSNVQGPSPPPKTTERRNENKDHPPLIHLNETHIRFANGSIRVNPSPMLEKEWRIISERISRLKLRENHEKDKLRHVEQRAPVTRTNWLGNLANHGFELNDYGSFQNFDAAFEQLIMIPWPFQNISLIDSDSFCREFLSRFEPSENDSPRVQQMIGSVQNKCSTLHAKLEQLRNVVVRNIEDTRAIFRGPTYKRTKRVAPLLLTGLAAFVGGQVFEKWFSSDSTASQKEIIARIDDLMKRQKDDNSNLKVVSEQMIGLTKALDERTLTLQSSLNTLATHLSTIQNYTLALTDVKTTIVTSSIMGDISAMQRSTALMFDYVFAQLNMFQWEEAFLSLREGKLPMNLISYNQLKVILQQVEERLPSGLKLAIQDQNWYDYYNYPISRFTITKDEIFIRLSIPLVSRHAKRRLRIAVPTAVSVPCTASFCTISDHVQAYIRPVLSGRSWVLDEEMNVVKEVDLQHLDCIPLGASHTCFTFTPAFVHKPSPCTQVLNKNNFKEMMNECRFELSDKTGYRPVKAYDGNYALHREAIEKYRIIDRHANSAPEERTVDSWSVLVQIPRNHILITSNQDFVIHGPVEMMSSPAKVHLKSRFSMFDRDLDLSNWTIRFDLKANRLPTPLNLTKFRNQLEFDSKSLSRMTTKLNKVVAEIDSRVDSFVHLFGKTKVTLNFWAITGLIFFTFQSFFILLLVLTKLRAGALNIFALEIIANIPTSKAFPLIPESLLSDVSILDSQAYSAYGKLIVVLLLLLIIILQLFCRRPSRVYLGLHDGFIDHSSRTTYWFKISFTAEKDSFFSSYHEIINIHIPLNLRIPANFQDLSLVSTTFHVIYPKDIRRLVADSLLSYRIVKPGGKFIKETGEIDFSQQLNVNLSEVAWKAEKPICITSNLRSVATVEIVLDPRPYFKKL